MKRKKNARDLRNENKNKLRERWAPASVPVAPPPERAKTSVMTSLEDSEEKRTADAREFLDYLEKTTVCQYFDTPSFLLLTNKDLKDFIDFNFLLDMP